LGALVLFAFLCTVAFADDYSGYTIGKITIRRNNVFDQNNPDESGVIGRGGNRIHTVTRESVIRNELLFKEGDPYDQRLIEETTRNLRHRSFLTDVQIDSVPNHETKAVDIVVNTRDQWSLILGGTFGGTSENSTTGLDFGEKNLAGLGQSISYNLRHNNSGYAHSIGFSDPNLLGSRYALRVGYDILPNENVTKGSVEQPFYSLSTRSAHGVSYTRTVHQEQTMGFTSYRFDIYYGRAVNFGENVLRSSLHLSLGEQNVYEMGVLTDIIRDNKVLIASELLTDPHNYAEETYMEKYRQKEDLPLGATYTFSVGQRMVSLGSTTSDVALGLGVTKWHRFFERDYLLAKATVARNDDNFNNQFGDMILQYYLRRFTHQIFVLRGQVSYSESETNRFRLGGTNGLRGFKADEFAGRNQVVFNLEDRIFTFTPMFSGIIEPGFVLFADAGNTWNNYSGDPLRRLNTSIGGGIRIALLKAPGISLIRADYGVTTEFNRPPVLTVGMEGFF